MDNEQAKLILSAYRPNGVDASDELFAAALEQARLDPELGEWFAEQRQFDEAVQAAVLRESSPERLRSSILAASHASAQQRPLQQSHARRFLMRPSSWITLAAALLLFAGVSVTFQSAGKSTLTREQFVKHALKLNGTGALTLGKMSDITGELHEWLAAQGAPHNFEIPTELQKLNSMGCQSIEIKGAKVSLICFILDRDRMVHLFVVEDDDLIDSLESTASMANQGTALATTWSSRGHTFLLTGMNVDAKTLRSLL